MDIKVARFFYFLVLSDEHVQCRVRCCVNTIRVSMRKTDPYRTVPGCN